MPGPIYIKNLSACIGRHDKRQLDLHNQGFSQGKFMKRKRCESPVHPYKKQNVKKIY